MSWYENGIIYREFLTSGTFIVQGIDDVYKILENNLFAPRR